MFKVPILSKTKDSKGILKYKIITLFIVVLGCLAGFFVAISCYSLYLFILNLVQNPELNSR
ncbi:hypothetical protein SAMN05443667_104238 [Flavobacterium gillisiae]|uniref:Uncharacterized protein n=1 Tax=Flavobacterium gillisiae TaxID=150146 RepID=A0A1H4B8T2_9FLAO|nr:hypothetical protein SAMN05443667_104238 [Flavobacterium gillisiae]